MKSRRYDKKRLKKEKSRKCDGEKSVERWRKVRKVESTMVKRHKVQKKFQKLNLRQVRKCKSKVRWWKVESTIKNVESTMDFVISAFHHRAFHFSLSYLCLTESWFRFFRLFTDVVLCFSYFELCACARVRARVCVCVCVCRDGLNGHCNNKILQSYSSNSQS